MGVINLSVLVDKIKRKLLNSGFITSSDKATKSAFGIVKVGDNISVSSGKISVPLATNSAPGVVQAGAGVTITDGVISAGGGAAADVLYQGTGAGTGSWVDNIELARDYTDYKLIFFNYGTLNESRFGGNCVYPPLLALNQAGYMRAGSNNDITIKFTALRKMSVIATSSVSDVTIIGIK